MRNLQVSHSLNRGNSKHRANVFLSRCLSSWRCRTLKSFVESLKCLCDLWHLSDLRRALRTLFSFETFSIFFINRILSGVGWLVKRSGALFLLRNKLKRESRPPREDTNAKRWGPSFTPQFIDDRSYIVVDIVPRLTLECLMRTNICDGLKLGEHGLAHGNASPLSYLKTLQCMIAICLAWPRLVLTLYNA